MSTVTLKAKLDQALKQALLGGDKSRATVLRGLKSAILYAEVAQRKRDQGLDDAAIEVVLAKEAKQRQESAELYEQGGRPERAQAELAEKAIIEAFLPPKLSETELQQIVDEVWAANPNGQLGQLIGQVRQQAGPGTDGAAIARLVKQRLDQ